ncbi:bleomycin resistance protein [Microbacterium hominis]|uniref:Bleomycin resistance protein n=1 Tax=Microbacterium hominis TaxID=162426 RepID=A0A7D4Q0B8_9MICO|nr:bleomycin resistance protein [Microbacterium hominis]QKJ18071.1 bleomycin resistance protein [Microbacterium hominis]
MQATTGLDRAVPHLPSRDFDRTERFYGGFGFERVFRDEGWMILTRGGLQLEFFPHPELDPATSSFMCSLRVADVDELYAAVERSGVAERTVGMPRLHPVRLQEWGLRAGYLIDPDGTQLALIEQPSTT